MSPQQEIVLHFKHYVRIPKGLLEQDAPLPSGKLGANSNATVSLGGKGRPLVVYLCNLNLSE